MKIFNKKEEKNKVGRPKLADAKLKKNAIIVSSICIIMILGLVLGGLFDLNIIKTNKLSANTNFGCTSIPEKLKYDAVNNKEGFIDIYFYNAVISSIPGATTNLCDAATKKDLEKIRILNLKSSSTIKNLNGINLIKNLEELTLYHSLNPIDIVIHDLEKLDYLFIHGDYNLVSLENLSNFSHLHIYNASKIKNLYINNLEKAYYISTGVWEGSYTQINNIYIKDVPNALVDFIYINSIDNLYMDNVAYFLTRLTEYSKNEGKIVFKNIGNLNDYLKEQFKNVSDEDLSREFYPSSPNNKILEMENVNFEYYYGGFSYSIFDDEEYSFKSISISNLYNLKNFAVYGITNEINYVNIINNNYNTLESIMLAYSNIKTIDLSHFDKLKLLVLNDNPIDNAKIFTQRNEIVQLDKLLKMNKKYKKNYFIENEEIIKENTNNELVGKKVGVTKLKLGFEDIVSVDENYENNDEYVLKNLTVEVYDIDSSKYDVNTMTKEIDVNNLSLDLNKIDITSDELTKVVLDDKLYIKYGEEIVDIYTLKNIKKNSMVIEDKTLTSVDKKEININNYKKNKNFDFYQNSKKDNETAVSSSIKNELLSNNGVKNITKVIYENNNKLLLIINGIEGVLLVILLTLLIKNIKRS